MLGSSLACAEDQRRRRWSMPVLIEGSLHHDCLFPTRKLTSAFVMCQEWSVWVIAKESVSCSGGEHIPYAPQVVIPSLQLSVNRASVVLKSRFEYYWVIGG